MIQPEAMRPSMGLRSESRARSPEAPDAPEFRHRWVVYNTTPKVFGATSALGMQDRDLLLATATNALIREHVGQSLPRPMMINIQEASLDRDQGVQATSRVRKRWVTGVDLTGMAEAPGAKFQRLRVEWEDATALMSSIHMFVDESYQQIVGMGMAAVPLILEDLRATGDQWFWALRSITGADPTKDETPGDTDAHAAAWIKWGEERGFIEP